MSPLTTLFVRLDVRFDLNWYLQSPRLHRGRQSSPYADVPAIPTTMIAAINVVMPATMISRLFVPDPFHSPVSIPRILATMIIEDTKRIQPIEVPILPSESAPAP